MRHRRDEQPSTRATNDEVLCSRIKPTWRTKLCAKKCERAFATHVVGFDAEHPHRLRLNANFTLAREFHRISDFHCAQ